MRVPFLNWICESHSVYLPEIDEEHKELFRLGDEVYEAMMEGASLSAVAPKLLALASQAINHFNHEEALRRSARYPSRAWHRGQHDVIRAKLAELERSIQGADREAVLPAIDYISAWLQTHTAVSDRMMGAYLRSHRRAERSGRARTPVEAVRGGPSCRRGSRRRPA